MQRVCSATASGRVKSGPRPQGRARGETYELRVADEVRTHGFLFYRLSLMVLNFDQHHNSHVAANSFINFLLFFEQPKYNDHEREQSRHAAV